MVLGLVYTDCDGGCDTKNHLAVVKQNLEQAIPSVAPIQIGPSGNTKTAYTNPAGGSFLLSMDTKIEQLLARTEALEQLRARTEALEQKSERQEEELTILRPLKETSVAIRDRFFAKFLEKMGRPGIGVMIHRRSPDTDPTPLVLRTCEKNLGIHRSCILGEECEVRGKRGKGKPKRGSKAGRQRRKRGMAMA